MLKNFLDLVLPTQGYRCIACSQNHSFHHSFCPNNQVAADTALKMDVAGDSQVYFGCASYSQPESGRKGTNVKAVRSFWLDIDTDALKGEGATPYRDQDAALVALEEFCFRLSLPSPVVVSSGFGLHVYWVLNDDIEPSSWRETALMLKRACDVGSLLADHSRTTDIASILRVPDAHNRKDAQNPRKVLVLYWGDPVSHQDFYARLADFLSREEGLDFPIIAPFASNLEIIPTTDHWFDRLSLDNKNACLADMLRVPLVISLADTPDSSPSPNWRTVLAACARSGAPEAYNLCRVWAQSSARFDQDNFDLRWRSYAAG